MRYLFSLITFLWLLGSVTFGQLVPADSTQIHELAQKLYDEGKLHGGLLVAEGETIIYQGAFGMADRAQNIPNAVNMRFFSASVGKMFTAILILQLHEQGKISLDDPVNKHLPWFEHEQADGITIHHLLSHRSGLAEIFSSKVNTHPSESVQRDLLEKIAEMELQFESGSAFVYSNTGYVLLGEIIMKYMGEDYNQILQDRIFKPLEMSSTYWSRAVYGPGSPINYLQDGTPYLPGYQLDFTGPGGEKTTLGDLHKFMLAVGSEELLKKESWALMFQAHSLPSEALMGWGPHQSPYGYGFSLIDLPFKGDQTAFTVSHGGTSSGTASYALRFLEEDRIVVLWNNEFKNPLLFELFEALAEMSKKE